MKFKVKYEKSNLIFMSSILLLCLIMSILFIKMEEYLYFAIYIILTLLLTYTYYFTTYILTKKYLVIRLGFIPIKFKYEHIWKVEPLDKGIKLTTKNFSVTIYPDEIKLFVKELKKRINEVLKVKETN